MQCVPVAPVDLQSLAVLSPILHCACTLYSGLMASIQREPKLLSEDEVQKALVAGMDIAGVSVSTALLVLCSCVKHVY